MLEMTYTTLEETAREIAFTAVNDSDWHEIALSLLEEGNNWEMMARNVIIWYLETYRYLSADCAFGVYSYFLPQALRDIVEEMLREHYEGE